MGKPPYGIVSDYDYDALHRLVSLTHTRTSDQAVLGRLDYTLGTDGRRVAVDELDAQGDLTRIDWTYDALGRLITEAYDLDADDLFDQGDFTADYYFDLVGNRVEKRTDTDGDSIVDEVISYLYDENDRLLVESLDSDGDSVIDQTTVYEYGPNAVTGNFGGDWTVQTKKTVWQGIDTDPGTGTKLSETTSSYNLQGRLEQVDIDSDGDGDLESRSTYVYNDAGIRVSQTVETDTTGDGVRDDVTTTDYVIDNNNHTGYAQVLEEKVASTVEKTYTLGHDVIAQQAPADASGSALFLLPDGHGSTRQLVDATGQPLVGEVYRYDAYGNPIGFDPSAALTTFLYSGEQTDRATGQQYLRARYYDMATGRFNRLDPFAGNLEDPRSLHKYLYGHADPVQNVDPSGLVSLGTTLGSIGIRISLGALNIARVAFPFAQTTIFRAQFFLLTNLWKIELGAIVGSIGLGAADAGARWLDQAIDRSIGNPIPYNQMDVGRNFENITRANGTNYEAIDHLVLERDDKVTIVTLSTRGGDPNMSDELFIERLRNRIVSKGEPISTGRVFTPRPGSGAPIIGPEQVADRYTVVGIPETRAHLIQDQRMISMLRSVQTTLRGVRAVAIPLRGWRPR